jgi:DNA-binding beta-propeller fold protein YncE
MAIGTLLTLLLAVTAAEPMISTVAGTGGAGKGGDGGPAVQAQLDQPFDVALDRVGNLYFSDTFNHRIRKVDHLTGTIETVAGDGTKGFAGDGALARHAQLNEPYGVVLDAAGNLYFVDRLNRRVRRVDAASGKITTVAGNGSKAYSGDGGPAPEAGLVEPNGVALSRDGRVMYIADVAGHRIRRVNLVSGKIDTFAGTGRGRHDGDGGPAAKASIAGARAVDVGPDGSVYILEREGNRLRIVDSGSGTIKTIAGTGAKGYSGDGGPALDATFNGPKELAVAPSGDILIVDTENHVIRRIDAASGRIQTVAGCGRVGGDGDMGPARSARLDRPHGVVAGADGRFWIGDTNNHRIRVVAPGR